jgi:hypothetical protein
MNRRGFLKSLCTAAVALTLSRTLPGIAGEPLALPEPPSKAVLFQKGDVVTIEGRYAINPVTRKSTGYPQQFVIIEDIYEGESDVTLFPAAGNIAPSRLSPVLIGNAIGDWQRMETRA